MSTSSTTETETGTLSGSVVNEEHTPLKDVMVVLRYDKKSEERGFTKRTNAAATNFMKSDTTYSADNGAFAFTKLNNTNYYLEVVASENRGSFITVTLDSVEKNIDVGEVLCTPLGSIRGRVDSTQLADVAFLYIRVLDCVIPVDNEGFFESRKIPAGNYSISVVEDNTIVESYFDTLEIKVLSDDTTHVAFKEDSVLFVNNSSTIALWSFSDQTGSTIADLSGNGYDLTLVDPVGIVPGFYSNALNLNDTGYGFVLPNEAFSASYISVEAVVLIDALPSKILTPRPHSMIVSNNYFDSNLNVYGYELRLTDTTGYPEFQIGTTDGWISALSSDGLETNRWYILTGTYDGSTITISVDSEVKAQTPYDGFIQYSSAETLALGRRYVDQAFYFVGIIDEIRISSTSPK